MSNVSFGQSAQKLVDDSTIEVNSNAKKKMSQQFPLNQTV
jgi:hypothetical protein